MSECFPCLARAADEKETLHEEKAFWKRYYYWGADERGTKRYAKILGNYQCHAEKRALLDFVEWSEHWRVCEQTLLANFLSEIFLTTWFVVKVCICSSFGRLLTRFLVGLVISSFHKLHFENIRFWGPRDIYRTSKGATASNMLETTALKLL